MLDERSRQVLFAVIQCYVNTPGPVGSRVVTKKYSFGLSPATIRNIMSDLEEMGYLRQPHTSAGRVPTDIGYRYYVDSLNAEERYVNGVFTAELSRKLELLRKDINAFLDEAARMLSALSHYVGITVSPNSSTTTLNRIELIKYRDGRVAVVIFTDEGLIRNTVIQMDTDLSQRDLNRITSYINEQFSGRTLEEVRKVVAKELVKEKVLCDGLISEAMRICDAVFSSAPGNIYISGLSEVLALPDFCNVDRIKELLKTIEDKHIVVKLLDKIADAEGPQVFIGSENPLDEMKSFSLVAATYREGKRPMGAVGIIGPTRMDYLQAISIVDLTAKYISEVLSS